jgi:hypothetical protein
MKKLILAAGFLFGASSVAMGDQLHDDGGVGLLSLRSIAFERWRFKLATFHAATIDSSGLRGQRLQGQRAKVERRQRMMDLTG